MCAGDVLLSYIHNPLTNEFLMFGYHSNHTSSDYKAGEGEGVQYSKASKQSKKNASFEIPR